ncbi:MAG: urease accessory protein UreE [Piscirickettsiaceae bacterium CG_4_9_14_3_um_filter_43_564]|nr:urease accessory protein UreE [Thiomicrospira sp.]OIP95840.1 MAG: urease accessory protein UreE [Thiomicrospira sp. CG2_30_44_34]PIQ06523.1 MAG: urease accessory protein UreE [Piscirickettsiaceae bacterium CG18_big_fil_WC_8_21_14_2_50_44_103]PIU38308.1 MAG: urease accessory protein UreE [Piscirickettsiaceae bacterium CG07_land_8_20_14_0_80_44_28]PIW56817.1 MAG: urease accessory protein UreE [Piscirickettsiaceae bacterium CG12_big_fil_rev_8_21_14_0_65_44_934]PIW77612.1 MAG: urease accessory 
MKEYTKILDEGLPSNAQELVLTFKQREKSRLKVSLATGEEIGLFLPRGSILKEGSVIASDSGAYLKIVAAPEKVSTVTSDDGHLLLRIAYHLGNRHVPLQVEPTWLRYAHDHVLDDMVRLLGGQVVVEDQPLQPESGAYGGGHSHDH